MRFLSSSFVALLNRDMYGRTFSYGSSLTPERAVVEPTAQCSDDQRRPVRFQDPWCVVARIAEAGEGADPLTLRAREREPGDRARVSERPLFKAS